MKALVARGVGQYNVEKIPVPKPGIGDILIRVEACGVCAGDVKASHKAARFWGGDGMPGYCEPPFIPGHEIVGEIAALGDGVDPAFAVGDRVVTEQIVPCRECLYCREGKYWLCDPHNVYGFKNHLPGGMAEYMILPKNSINYAIDKALPIEKAILIEPYACSLHGVHRAEICAEHTVVVSGTGTLGLGMIAAIRQRSPKTLIALDMLDQRLEVAKRFGVEYAINPGKEDAVRRVLDLTGGYGCDVYIEVAGHPSSVRQGLEMIRKGGSFVEFSVFDAPTTADWSIIGDAKEIVIRGSQLSPHCYPETIEGITSGQTPTDGVVTHTFALENWARAYEVAQSGDAIKVIIVPA